MHDLLTFLRARFDEDDRAARLAADYRSRPSDYDASDEERWHWVAGRTGRHVHVGAGYPNDYHRGVELRSVNEYPKRSEPGLSPHHVLALSSAVDNWTADHIARHDPARVTSEIEAKRRILELFDASRGGREQGRPGWAEDVLRLLALPYAEHPDYRAEWGRMRERVKVYVWSMADGDAMVRLPVSPGEEVRELRVPAASIAAEVGRAENELEGCQLTAKIDTTDDGETSLRDFRLLEDSQTRGRY
ncbi:DUF6221 family protein [Actinoallomurus iriomotensis]|uniref:Uncharacterized protein n=1 Tax=Actinoallomurus iriomotensis TaxID=478107 RepID=A0A9W6S849_9ACTN|nr:DUF6221 family protein [Actinoallomurus iriomotensis]GLY87512.1 hypothetical protein Airi02_054410 [Actinoallomurus iriomotensis]